jgi:crossover junction endodeoxyribonuclease RuvC
VTILGIDIGLTGAIARLEGDKAEVFDIPTVVIKSGRKKRRLVDEAALAALLAEVMDPLGAEAFVEAAQATPRMGVSSAFHYGETFGLIKGALWQLGVNHMRVVQPFVWKRAMGLVTKGRREIGRNEAREKGSSLELARKLYPALGDELHLRKHDGRAEALLIAWWGAEESGL